MRGGWVAAPDPRGLQGRPEMQDAMRSYREGNPSAGCHKTPHIQILVCPQGEPGSHSCVPRVAHLPAPTKPAGALASAVPPCRECPGPFSPEKTELSTGPSLAEQEGSAAGRSAGQPPEYETVIS